MNVQQLNKTLNYLIDMLTHREVEGRENIPKDGAVIIAANHLGLFDVPLTYLAVGRADMTGWVAHKHLKNPLYRYLVNVIGGVWLNRENPDMHALKEPLRLLKAGRAFGVAPEGTRSRTKALLPGKEGVAYLAIASGAPIVPAAHTGTEKVWREFARLRKPHLHIRFGKPFRLPPLERDQREEQLAAGIEEIMCRIAALLPEEYRGVYAGHKRVRELLAETKEQGTPQRHEGHKG